MDYILTLNKINKSDTSIAGFKGVDLAQLYNKKLNIPICFVIKSSLFDDFIEGNNLKQNIDNILKEIDYSNEDSLTQAHAKISELILNTDFSQEVQNEISEAYETLAIDMDHIDIAKLVTTIEKPFLTVIGSPNYIGDSENNESVFQNIRRKNNLFKAIKECWVSLYTPKALLYRKKSDIDTKEKMAVIVQRMVDSKISIQATTDEKNIVVKTFHGFQDYNDVLGKDEYTYLKENLSLKDSKINFQEFQIIRDIQNETLIKKPLKNEGEKQKLNDKDVEEIARITKKVESIIENPIKIFFSISKNRVYLLFANQIVKEEVNSVSDDLNNETSNESTIKNNDEISDEVPVPEEDEKEITDEVPIPEDGERETQEEITDDIPTPEDENHVNPDAKQENSLEETNEKPNGIEIEEVDFDDDVAFLEEIEKYEKESNKEEVKQEKKEEPIINDSIKESVEVEKTNQDGEITTPDVNVQKEESVHEEKPVETPKEDNNFIFSEFEGKTQKEEVPAEPEEQTPKLNPIENLDKAHEKIKNIIILSDDAIFQALSKKYEEVLSSKPESFEMAIDNLKNSVRVPFIDEIKKVHDIRTKLDNNKSFEIEEATIALRTAKNFLTIFSE